MILSDLPGLKEGPRKSILSVYYSTWNLLDQAYVNAPGECVLVEGFITECTVAFLFTLCEAGSPETLDNLLPPQLQACSSSFGLLALSADDSQPALWS